MPGTVAENTVVVLSSELLLPVVVAALIIVDKVVTTPEVGPTHTVPLVMFHPPRPYTKYGLPTAARDDEVDLSFCTITVWKRELVLVVVRVLVVTASGLCASSDEALIGVGEMMTVVVDVWISAPGDGDLPLRYSMVPLKPT